MTYDIAAVLEKYRRKKTPEMRRDVIRQAAHEYGVPARQIAEDLLALGQQVDRRLLNGQSNRPRLEHRTPEPENVPESDTPEPEPEHGTRVPAGGDPSHGMTIATLRELITGMDGTAELCLEDSGRPITGMTVTADFDRAGERIRCTVMLWTEGV